MAEQNGAGQASARPTTQVDQTTGVDQRIADLRALLEQGLADGIGVGSSLGILLEHLEVGRSVWTMRPSPAAANAMFIVHGGVIATLMDTAMGSAVFTTLPGDTFYTTLELKVNFVRPVGLTADRLTCEARTVHVGRRTATAESTVTSADGKLVAHGTCTCLLTPA
ncbi:PaaI family thioesterase [Frankia sp. CN6]|uniref:PaaI family thioesterase n=1 Tax=Frankia nepalensis TaxID=1836974 RepID=A0A937ULJ8_9ACTN|nr:PaaI family thioesterase [Frankia nepalensis]